ncbi:hypothetical protein [Vibrio sp. L3-7]|uniref:hypothetical protein n=1 Tax=Vibrio sp. L3-7 TaxID=2912253 RepID=UPI001645E254|nr:hypothetical protein [Vibrio sp. L3-7]MCF7505538.1 hypothetical protein [Vibrio sp. L3-7]
MSFRVKVLMVSVSLSASVASANHCDPKNWQTLLDRQLSTENRYNQYTKEFNQALSSYESQTLLSKHFTETQIIELWAKYEDRFNVQLNSHMNTAYRISEVLLKRAYVVSTELEDAQSLIRSWQSMTKHCESSTLPSQSESASLHVKGSQSLAKDINTLSEKFRKLSVRYRNEATMIDSARHENGPIQEIFN